MPRGRPKGAKNKVSRETTKGVFSIGTGKQFKFPIVRDGNTRTTVASLTVGAESFVEALKAAVHWALAYSESNGTEFWPLVKYIGLAGEKRFVKRVDCNSVWAESADYGCWLPICVLREVA